MFLSSQWGNGRASVKVLQSALKFWSSVISFHRNPPTGPASSSERGPRTEDERFAGIHNVLTQNTSSSQGGSFERSDRSERNPDRGASIRGRASRPGGYSGANNTGSSGANTSPAVSQPSMPNAGRLYAIPSRLDNRPKYDEDAGESRG